VRNRNLNIAFLALFQLLIFVAPLIIKAEHHRESDSGSSSHWFAGNTFSKEEHCFICSFEFVTFINQLLPAYFFLDLACAINFTLPIEQIFKFFFLYFSLRAPPIA
jgi:hypothetical protein